MKNQHQKWRQRGSALGIEEVNEYGFDRVWQAGKVARKAIRKMMANNKQEERG